MARNGTLDQNMEKVLDYLLDNPVELPYADALADAIGIEPVELREVLFAVRDPDFIEKHGWTIPYTSKGRGMKTFSISIKEEDKVLTAKGLALHARESHTRLRRELAQNQMMYNREPNKRSSPARAIKDTCVVLEAALLHVERQIEVAKTLSVNSA
jgi:hypothetical protein